jgi:hypothetical protein
MPKRTPASLAYERRVQAREAALLPSIPTDTPVNWTGVWANATSFYDLLALNVLFLKGTLKGTPYHMAPIVQDHSSEIPLLIQLQYRGLYTVNGQPGVCTPKDGTFAAKTNRWYNERQRAFLVFYMPKSPRNMALVRYLSRNQKVAVRVVTYQNKIQKDSIPLVRAGSRYNLTRARAAPTQETLSAQKWDADLNLPSRKAIQSDPEIVQSQYRMNGDQNPLLKRYLMVEVAFKTYCQQRLPEVLIKWLDAYRPK